MATSAIGMTALLPVGDAAAQTDSVSVDLSVIDGGGYGGGTPYAPQGGLRMPGTEAPRSTYFGPEVTVDLPSFPEPAPSDTGMAAAEPAAPPEPAVAESKPPEPPSASGLQQSDMTEAPPPPTDTAAADEAPPPPPEPEVESGAAPPPPPPPEPEATAMADAEPEAATESQAASLPEDDGMAGDGRLLQVMFSGDDANVPDAAKRGLDEVAGRIQGDDELRVQLMAYAGGEGLTASKARRISLSRALAVRSYLIDKGVRSTRIDVRALGDKTSEDPRNRVDVTVVER